MSDKITRNINSAEGMWFLVILAVSKILFADIGRYVLHSGTAAYMQVLWCGMIALAIFIISAKLSEGMDILGAAEVSGRTAGATVGIIIFTMLIINAAVMLRVYTDIIASIALPEVSDLLILAVIAVVAVFAAFAGVSTLVAYAYVVGIVLISALGVILILNIPNYDITNIYPLLGNGAERIITGTGGLSAYADVFLVFLFAPYLRSDSAITATGVGAILISTAVIAVTTLMYVLTIPFPASAEFTLPVLEIAFDVNLDIVFQRAEGLFLFLWIFSGFVVIGAYVCFAILSAERAFHLSDRRAIIGVVVFIAVCVAFAAESSPLQSKAYEIFYMVFTVLSFALPIVVYGVRKVRG